MENNQMPVLTLQCSPQPELETPGHERTWKNLRRLQNILLMLKPSDIDDTEDPEIEMLLNLELYLCPKLRASSQSKVARELLMMN